MPKRLTPTDTLGVTTDHRDVIGKLRHDAAVADLKSRRPGISPRREYALQREARAFRLAAELLEIHDATGISLDNWETARAFVEDLSGETILENGV